MDDPGLKAVDRVRDPNLSAEALGRLPRKINSLEVGRGLVTTCIVLSLWGAFFWVIVHLLRGPGEDASWWWIFISVLPILIGIGYALATTSNPFSSKLKNYVYNHCVRPADLDGPSLALMLRTQGAIRSALGSEVYAHKSLKHAVEEPVLRRHEWDVATNLRRISELRSEHQASTKGETPGPMTAKVLESQRHALTVATAATTSRISALERYAAELKMADAAEHDWQAAMKASGRNDRYVDLIAHTAADEHAIAEIEGLTEHAAAAARALDEHLYQAGLAAQALVLPTTPKDPQSEP
jgi:hypothetical protein